MSSRRLFILLAATCVCLSYFASSASTYPVFGERWLLRQPDGSTVEVRIWGDEYYQVVESLDGYTLIRDRSTEVICYARLSTDGNELVSTGVPVGTRGRASLGVEKHVRISGEARDALIERMQRQSGLYGVCEETEGSGQIAPTSGPVLGNVEGLVILVDFVDQPGEVSRDDIDDMFNEVGFAGYGNNGSVRDYFYDVSNGNLNYTNWMPPVYYRARYPFAHYDDCHRRWPAGPLELIVETLDHLESEGLDFRRFDADGDGFIDAFAMMYAGSTYCGWAKGMWAGGGEICSLWVSATGVATGRGHWIGTASTPTIAGFCHEAGHSVCRWPDLYDYDHNSEGIGRYCLMSNSASRTNPVEPCAYLKYEAGWGTVTTFTAPEKGIAVPVSSSNTIFKYEHPTLANEYFLIENRQQTGRDSEIPDNGIAVWHIDTSGSNSWNRMLPDEHFMVTLVQADGRWDMEKNKNEGDPSDLYAAPTATELTPFTTPSSSWWDGSISGLCVEHVSQSSPLMTFDFDINIPTTISVGDVATVSQNKSVWAFRVELENTGPSDAYDLVGTVTEDLPWIAVRKASCRYDDIRSGGAADPRGVYLLASELHFWPETPFSADLNITWENQWGRVYADTVTLVFHPSLDVSVVDNDIAVGETRQKFEDNLLLDLSKIDTTEVEAPAGAYATCLERNYPNPFNPLTTIPYQITEDTWVSLDIYDATGWLVRRLVNASQPAGPHAITWAGRDESDRPVASGVYFYRLTAGDKTLTKKMVLLR